jgi:hypothetical protein
MRAWGAAVAGGHLALALIAAIVLRDDSTSLFFGLCAVATFALSQAVAPLLRRRPGPGDEGGGSPPPDDPPPPWWPDFEREFRDYAEKRTRVPA